MTKLTQPLLSLSAHGTLGDTLTFTKPDSQGVVRRKPVPPYSLTLPQQYQRWLYQDYAALWHSLTTTQKRYWHAEGSKRHRPAFSAFLHYYLADLPDIVGSWHLDELGGSVAHDSSRHLAHATMYGTSPVPGAVASSRYFDGVDDWIDTEVCHDEYITDEITLMCFITIPTGAPSHTSVVFGNAPDANYSWLWYIPWDYKPDFYLLLDGFGQYHLRFPVAQNNGERHHYAATFDGRYYREYRDAVLWHTKDIGVDTIKRSGAHTQMGKYNADRAEFTLDNAIVLNRALPQSQIQTHSERRYP